MAAGSDYENTDAVAPLDPARASSLCALVSVGGVVTSYELPTEGVLAIGRSSTCDVVIEHASVSRRHALLQCGPLAITDLNSRNRVRLRGVHVPPNVATPFEVGEAVQLGEVTVLIHQRAELDESAVAWGDPRAMGADRSASAMDAVRLDAADTEARRAGASGLAALAPSASRGARTRGAEPALEPTPMARVRALVAQVAAGELTVLITGETGVGKELCAEQIHRLSPRARGPFVKLNCSAIAESLLESELFGHERGAFTGAATATGGLFEAGDGGTVFLDEIGELPLAAQAKLLRVLEERVVRRVGGTASRTLDVRFVCATNRVLLDEVEAGRFRRDLYYRIAGVAIAIPPLRERLDELDGLARLFVERARPGALLELDALAALAHHDWPGNVRELRNAMERAALLAGNGPIRAAHLAVAPGPAYGSSASRPSAPLVHGGAAGSGGFRANGFGANDHGAPPGLGANGVSNAAVTRPSRPTLPIPRIDDAATTLDQSLPTEVADLERRRILETLSLCGGNQTRAARALGISRNTLLARLDSYGLPRPRKT